MPTWLSSPGPVFLRRHARSSKYEPLVEEVELVHATPNYARVRLSTGRETMVPLRDIALMKRAPAPLFDAANQRDVALSGGSSLEPENLNSDHAISADDQQAPCEDTGNNVVRGRNDRGTLPSEDISHDTSPCVDDAVRVEPAAQSASPGASAMDYGGQRVKGDQSTAMGLFPITDVITLYACNVSAYVVHYFFVFVFINLCSQLRGVESPAIISL